MALATGALLVGGASPGAASSVTTKTFSFTGAAQTFTVPAGIFSIHVLAVGGQGGKDGDLAHFGGFGSRIEADMAVFPGQILQINVGGLGADGAGGAGGAGGFGGGAAGGTGTSDGGGGGGGYSDIRTEQPPLPSGSFPIGNELIVAAGGGGAGADGAGTGADGGDASSAGGNGSVASGGGAGTGVAGGAGGTGGVEDGANGSRSAGGAGGGVSGSTAGGGGGGGGYYGGGGGGGSLSGGAGGGGGGSDYVDATASSPSISVSNHVGNGTVVLSYAGPNADLQQFSVFAAEVQTNGLTGSTIDTNVLPTMPDPLCCNFGGTTVTAGRRIQWDTSAINAGPDQAANTAITVSLPAGTSLIENTLTGLPTPGNVPGRCTAAPAGVRTTVVCQYGAVDVGKTASLRFQVLVDQALPRGTQLSFDSTATSDTRDPNTSNNLTSIQFDDNTRADLQLTKTGLGPIQWIAGEERTIRYDIADKGPSLARDARLTDTLPAGLEVVSAFLGAPTKAAGGVRLAVSRPGQAVATAAGSCDVSGANDLTCLLGDVANADGNHSLFLHVRVKPDVPSGTVLSSNGVVSSDTADPLATDNTEGDSQTTATSADVGVAIASDQNIYKKKGVKADYTVSVQNKAPSDAQSVVATLTLPATSKAKYVFATTGCTLLATTLTCNLGTIAAGTTRSFDVYLKLKTNGLITTSVAAASTTPDPNAANNSAAKTVKVGK